MGGPQKNGSAANVDASATKIAPANCFTGPSPYFLDYSDKYLRIWENAIWPL